MAFCLGRQEQPRPLKLIFRHDVKELVKPYKYNWQQEGLWHRIKNDDPGQKKRC